MSNLWYDAFYIEGLVYNIYKFEFHLSLVRTVSVSWDRASLYLELARGSIDCNAFTQWVRAKARVLSRPSLLRTASKAAWTSPGLENLLAIMASSSGNFALANKTGAVARPSSRSAAAGLPSCSELKKKRKSYKCYPFELCYSKCQFSTDRIKQRSNV